MARVTKSMDAQGDAFALFHAATTLEQTVKERTLELEQANEELQAALIKEKELALARDKAIDSSQLKSQFLANMSHEIRTPMNGVIGMTSLLLDTPLSDEQLDYVNIIRTSGESLLAIINDILDFSKIEAGKMVLERQSFNLSTCIEEALDLVASSASKKGLELLYFCTPGVPEIITSDVTRLRQILVNLLSNAVKFTAQGEILVNVSAQRLPDNQYNIEVTVKDTGIGIPEDRIGILFDAFSQVDDSTTRKFGGTGLGLAICYQLATLLGGDLKVESELGKGSSFICNISAPGSMPNGAQQDNSALLHDKHVLIVDDNATNLHILSSLVASWGMRATVCASPSEALSIIHKRPAFDTAILDFQMPEMDGLELARTLSRLDESCRVPLIMLSSISDRHADKEGLFAAWLTKPAKPNQLYHSLVRIFGKKETHPIGLDPTLNTRQSKLRILLAEDNAINQKVAVHMLNRMGYRVDIVANGQEAINALKHIPYDVILMDMMMPDMDGIEATHRIRENLKGHQPYIIALTANAMEDDRQRCLEAGMNAHLPKPIKMDMLQKVLNQIAIQIHPT